MKHQTTLRPPNTKMYAFGTVFNIGTQMAIRSMESSQVGNKVNGKKTEMESLYSWEKLVCFQNEIFFSSQLSSFLSHKVIYA